MSTASPAEKIATVAYFRPYFADAPRVQWTKSLLGDSSESGYYVEQTSDGGYLVSGMTGMGLHLRLVLAKTNSTGGVIWTRILGDTLHQPTMAFAAQQTADGGFIIGANGALDARDRVDIWLVKLDRTGNTVWQREVSSDSWPVAFVEGHALVQTSDGGYALTAHEMLSDSALILFKTDSLGNRQWLKRYPRRIDDGTYDMFPLRQTTDGGYIIGTRTLLKVDSCGKQQWLRTFTNVINADAVVQTTDGGYVAAVQTSDYSGACLLKVSADGSPEWMVPRLAGQTGSGSCWLEQATDGGLVVAGSYRSADDYGVACVFRLTSNGIHLWTDSLCRGAAMCVRETRDGGYIVTGTNYIPPPPPYGTHYLFLTKLAPERTR